MLLKINHTKILQGEVEIPSSKSHCIRAIFFGLLAKGETILENMLYSSDTAEALRIITQLGAEVIRDKYCVIIRSAGAPL